MCGMVRASVSKIAHAKLEAAPCVYWPHTVDGIIDATVTGGISIEIIRFL